jgi:sensor histidine kinase regulating citrate/malate metabolism
MKGIIKKAKKFSKEIVLLRAFAILMKDEHGQVIYTFDSKKKADEFYKELTKSHE